MSARDQIELECVELPDALEFTVTRHRGWASMALFPLLAIVVVAWLWTTGMLPLRIMAVLGLASSAVAYVTNFMHGNRTKLRVTENELIAKGNFGQLFQRELRIDAGELTLLQWEPVAEGDDSGLYARWGWHHRCLLANITSAQAEGIRHAIADKFPKLRVFDSSPASILFGNESGVTNLGLRETDSGASKLHD